MDTITETSRAAPSDAGSHDDLHDALCAIVAEGDPSSGPARAKLIEHLRETLKRSRETARTMLEETGQGVRCAQMLSDDMDDMIGALYRLAAESLYRVSNPSLAERLALVAVGGYGRGTLAPGSDIDLLFLLPYKQTPWGESVVEFVLYVLWDLGLKVGHATRTPEDCLKQAGQDMTIRTTLLEMRRLCGDRKLFSELKRGFEADAARTSPQAFIEAKLHERDARHQRAGRSRYMVEPNIKEGKGGLRDLHTLFWIGRAYLLTVPERSLRAAGILNRAEQRRFRRCEDFLWAVRCHMHFLTGRPEERLSFDIQVELAERLGYTKHPGLRAVERFMKHYFLVAKDVGVLTRILCAALEERQAKAAPGLNRLIRNAITRRRRIKDLDGAVLEHGRITLVDPGLFARDPVNLVRIFHVAAENNLSIHPDALQLVTRSLRLIRGEVRRDPEANRLLLDILANSETGEAVLRLMNETGVLGRFIPEFGRVVAMMQFNMYHHYTVDEHLLQSLGQLARIERGERDDETPLAHRLMPNVKDRLALYVALFLHDVAKGRDEDHSIAGARVARRLCPRLGLERRETELIAWLIEEHLTMSIIAQSRDLSDRRTILDFAAKVQTRERLDLLLILTVCDIRAVGPGVWNGWKGQLLRTLYFETEPILTGGFSKVKGEHSVEAAREALRSALGDWNDAEVRDRIVEMHYPAYLLRVDLETQVRHARMVREADEAGESVAFQVAPMSFEGATEIMILTPDHPKLLSLVAGACTAADANIAEAQIFTTADGRALDRVMVTRAFERDEDERRRAGRIVTLLREALEGKVRLGDVIAAGRRPAKRDAFTIEPRVEVDNGLSDRFTVISVECLDRPGLLFELTRAIGDLNLDIASAHVATFGEKAFDTFYVTDLVGDQIRTQARRSRIESRLMAAVGGLPAKAKSAAS